MKDWVHQRHILSYFVSSKISEDFTAKLILPVPLLLRELSSINILPHRNMNARQLYHTSFRASVCVCSPSI